MHHLEREWTVDDLASMPDDGNRYEIIDGQLFVTPAPTTRHQRMVGELFAVLHDYLRREPIGVALFAPLDVVYSDRRIVQPDVLVVPKGRGTLPDRFERGQSLLLAVEVLSPSTARADRVSKRRLYAEEGVGEYWIVDLDARVIERSTPADERPELIVDTLLWRPEGAAAPLVIDVPALFAEVSGG